MSGVKRKSFVNEGSRRWNTLELDSCVFSMWWGTESPFVEPEEEKTELEEDYASRSFKRK